MAPDSSGRSEGQVDDELITKRFNKSLLAGYYWLKQPGSPGSKLVHKWWIVVGQWLVPGATIATSDDFAWQRYMASWVAE